jgi:hypothetical protein
LIVLVLIVAAGVSPVAATDKPQTDGSAMDALGEFLRGMKMLSGGKKALPGGDPFLERVRTKYEIPDRIEIFAPRGGSEIIALVFDSEGLPVVDGRWSEIFPDEYKYLQSQHNLKVVYCLHEKEPLDLGDVVVAVRPDGPGALSVYFNDKRGAVGSARIRNGNAILFSGSKHIVRPLAARL